MRKTFQLVMVCFSVALGGCEPDEPCDPGQIFGRGRCVVCPADSKVVSNRCVCNTEGHVFSEASGLCVPGEGGVPFDEDAGASEAGASQVSELCSTFCEFSKACVADNSTAAAIVGMQLQQLGIQGEDISECVSMCEEASSSPAALAPLRCVSQQQESSTCATRDDLGGAQQALGIYNACCAGAASEGACALTCSGLGSSTIGGLLAFCKQ